MLCRHCGSTVSGVFHVDYYYVDGFTFCNKECAHEAGDRSVCGDWCPCTKYAIKRRHLRQHRTQMRIMEDIIFEHHHERQYEDEVIEVTGNTPYWLGHTDLDEDSDAEDPEAQLRAELAALRIEVRNLRLALHDQQNLIQAVHGIVEARKRAELEDIP